VAKTERDKARQEDFVSLVLLVETFVWRVYRRSYGVNQRNRVQTEFIRLRRTTETFFRVRYRCNSG